jgi:hypothetical protein
VYMNLPAKMSSHVLGFFFPWRGDALRGL